MGILRGVVDQDRSKKNRFILTGSSSPELLKHATNSLAGRVALVELGTLLPSEQTQLPIPEFYQYMQGQRTAQQLTKLTTLLDRTQVHQAWLRGGYPEPVLHSDPLFFEYWMSEYQKSYLFRDVASLFPRLNHQAYQRFLSVLARLSGTILNKRELARSIEISESSIKDYLQIATGTFLWRSIPSFEHHPLRQVVKMPKGHFRDKGLLNYLLRIRTLDDLLLHPQVGYLFESFIIESIIRYLDILPITNWNPYYYRTKHGAEVDLILEGHFGMLPIEIKLGETVSNKNLVSLHYFIEDLRCDIGIVINQARDIRWLSEKVIQIPVEYIV
jgi:predicted AAA+ superfamily ATPase